MENKKTYELKGLSHAMMSVLARILAVEEEYQSDRRSEELKDGAYEWALARTELLKDIKALRSQIYELGFVSFGK